MPGRRFTPDGLSLAAASASAASSAAGAWAWALRLAAEASGGGEWGGGQLQAPKVSGEKLFTFLPVVVFLFGLFSMFVFCLVFVDPILINLSFSLGGWGGGGVGGTSVDSIKPCKLIGGGGGLHYTP